MRVVRACVILECGCAEDGGVSAPNGVAAREKLQQRYTHALQPGEQEGLPNNALHARMAAMAARHDVAERLQFTFGRFSPPSPSAAGGALLPKKAVIVFCGRNVHALVSLSSAHGGSGRGAIAASSSLDGQRWRSRRLLEAARWNTRGSGWAPSGQASPVGCVAPHRVTKHALRRHRSRSRALPRGVFWPCCCAAA